MWMAVHHSICFYISTYRIFTRQPVFVNRPRQDATRVGHDPYNRKSQRKTIQLLFDGHASFAQRQIVASFSAPRVTK
jgi:hypothetical protein